MKKNTKIATSYALNHKSNQVSDLLNWFNRKLVVITTLWSKFLGRNINLQVKPSWTKFTKQEILYWACSDHCVKSVQIRSYFWSVFSCIRTEYGDLLRNVTQRFTGFSQSTYFFLFRRLAWLKENSFFMDWFHYNLIILIK